MIEASISFLEVRMYSTTTEIAMALLIVQLLPSIYYQEMTADCSSCLKHLKQMCPTYVCLSVSAPYLFRARWLFFCLRVCVCVYVLDLVFVLSLM